GIGADRHEGAAAERDLSAVAHENIEADGGKREDEERDQDSAQKIIAAEWPDPEVGEQWNAKEGNGEQQPQSHAILANREDSHIGRIGGFELAGFAIEHCVLRKRVANGECRVECGSLGVAAATCSYPLDQALAEQALWPH